MISNHKEKTVKKKPTNHAIEFRSRLDPKGMIDLSRGGSRLFMGVNAALLIFLIFSPSASVPMARSCSTLHSLSMYPCNHREAHIINWQQFFSGDFVYFSVLYSILLHLPPHRFHCVGPRTVATTALAVRRSIRSARSHPHSARSNEQNSESI